MTISGFAFLVIEMVLTVLFAAGIGFILGWLVRPILSEKQDQEWNLKITGLREDVRALSGLLNHEREKKEKAERIARELELEVRNLEAELGKTKVNS